jgi:hypothetical protein
MKDRKLFENTKETLSANGVYESDSYRIPTYDEICGKIYADQSGTFQILESDDKEEYDVTHEFTINSEEVTLYNHELFCNYAKVKFINDSVDQTEFRLSLYFDQKKEV